VFETVNVRLVACRCAAGDCAQGRTCTCTPSNADCDCCTPFVSDHDGVALTLGRYATILVPSLLTAPRYFAGEIEFGVIAQVGSCCWAWVCQRTAFGSASALPCQVACLRSLGLLCWECYIVPEHMKLCMCRWALHLGALSRR
jgi:hypothetical protein